jgi:hypothetical protein
MAAPPELKKATFGRLPMTALTAGNSRPSSMLRPILLGEVRRRHHFNAQHSLMKTRAGSLFVGLVFIIVSSLDCLGADSSIATNSAGTAMMHAFLKQEAVRLDDQFLERHHE